MAWKSATNPPVSFSVAKQTPHRAALEVVNVASDSRVPFVAAILPKAAVAPADVAEGLDGFDAHHVFRHLVAELAFDPQAQRGAMGYGKRFIVHLIGEDRLRMKSVDEIDRLVILSCPVERLLQRVGAIKDDVARRRLQPGVVQDRPEQ